LTKVVAAIKSTVVALSEHVLAELDSEYYAACRVDIGFGYIVEPGYPVGSSELRDGFVAAEKLILRARKILSSPSRDGRYTVRFAKALKRELASDAGVATASQDWPEPIRKLAMRSLPEVACVASSYGRSDLGGA
jgi:hypothetical protein